MSSFPSCFESENVICKHIRANIVVYVNLDSRLSPGETVESSTASSSDDELTVGSPNVVETDTVVEQTSSCGGLTLKAGRAVAFEISGGTSIDEETIVVVGFLSTDGQQDYVDCRLFIGGTPAP